MWAAGTRVSCACSRSERRNGGRRVLSYYEYRRLDGGDPADAGKTEGQAPQHEMSVFSVTFRFKNGRAGNAGSGEGLV